MVYFFIFFIFYTDGMEAESGDDDDSSLISPNEEIEAP